MNLSEAIRTINESSARLNIAVGLIQDAWHRLDDDSPGFPGGHEGSGNSSTQPERTELARDQAYSDLRTLKAALRDNLRTSTQVYDIASRWGVRRMEVEGQLPVEWCRSCHRDNKHCEPTAHGRYKDLCRFCGDWNAAHKALPPHEIIEARHRGMRITSVMVQRAIAKQREEKAQQKAKAKKAKKAS